MSEWRRITTEGYEIVTFYNPRENRWVTMLRDPKTKRFIKRLKGIEIKITFSIETGKGNEPLTVEITASTSIPSMSERRLRYWIRRIVNMAIKLIYLYFDVEKDLAGKATRYADYIRYRVHSFRAARVTSERTADWLIRRLIELGAFMRPLNEYFTHEAFIKIGIEYTEPKAGVMLPYVRYYIEKKGRRGWRKTVRLLSRMMIDMTRIFGIQIEFETPEEAIE